MSFVSNLSKELVNSLSSNLSSSASAFGFQGDTYWYCQKEIKIGKVDCVAHLYLDKKKRTQQESKFLAKIYEFENIFYQKTFQDESSCRTYINDTFGVQKKFFKIKKENEYFVLERNVDDLEVEINRMGCVILLTDSKINISRDEVLSLYRNKDSIEKIFFSLKHNLNEKRNRMHSLQNMKGSLFINFIALILISWIDHVMKEKELYKDFSKDEVYKILDRLKFYKLATGKVVLGEISGKQKTIYSAFNIGTHVDHRFEI